MRFQNPAHPDPQTATSVSCIRLAGVFFHGLAFRRKNLVVAVGDIATMECSSTVVGILVTTVHSVEGKRAAATTVQFRLETSQEISTPLVAFRVTLS